MGVTLEMTERGLQVVATAEELAALGIVDGAEALFVDSPDGMIMKVAEDAERMRAILEVIEQHDGALRRLADR